jgi:hypothetical protein
MRTIKMITKMQKRRMKDNNSSDMQENTLQEILNSSINVRRLERNFTQDKLLPLLIL